MDAYTKTIYDLYPLYKLEVDLQYTEYPLSRESIAEFLEIKKDESPEEAVAMLFEKPKEVAELLGITKTYRMLYADFDIKIRHCVSIINFKLTYNDLSTVDSHRIFYEKFNRTPTEDDEFIELSGRTIHPHRRGKSAFSCFVLDKDENLFIFPYRLNTMQHTFITRGEAIFFAGTMKVIDGLIDYIDDNSGHYRPHPSSILSIAYHFKGILGENIGRIFTNDFGFKNVGLVDSFAHTEVTFAEKEKIRRQFLRVIERE